MIEMLSPVATGILHFWSQVPIDIFIADLLAFCTVAFQLADIPSQTALHDIEASIINKRMRIFFVNPKRIHILFLGLEKEISERQV